jgi:hypothetical protein
MKSPDGDQKIGLLMAVKRMTLLAEQRSLVCRKDLQLHSEDVTEDRMIEHHSLASRTSKAGRPTSQVLVEWLQYNSWWGEEIIGKELRIRVESIAELLSSTGEPTLPAVLHCQGFFHHGGRSAFGLVYTIPSLPGDGDLEIVTLNQVLGKSASATRPLLGDRFNMAHELVLSVLTFHKVGWLHRALIPSNIIFFSRKGSPEPRPMRRLYTVGFSCSRQNEEHAFTAGPGEGREYKEYQHPEYQQSRIRFRHEFDYLPQLGHDTAGDWSLGSTLFDNGGERICGS